MRWMNPFPMSDEHRPKLHKQRLQMSTWLLGEKAADITYNTWTEEGANQTPLKPAFQAIFGPVYRTSVRGLCYFRLETANS